MTISFPIAIPSGREGDIARALISPVDAIAVSQSPFSFAQQVYEHSGKRWVMNVDLNPLSRTVAAEWMAFLSSLRGRYGTFKMGDPSASTPRGTGSGTPIVSTASQSGFTLAIAGFTSSETNILKKGDWVQVNDGSTPRLYMNLQDVNTTSGGVCTLDLWPSLRAVPNSGATVYVNSCHTVWRLSASAGWQIDGPGIYQMSFAAEEAL